VRNIFPFFYQEFQHLIFVIEDRHGLPKLRNHASALPLSAEKKFFGSNAYAIKKGSAKE
jgi:hypothetical protein